MVLFETESLRINFRRCCLCSLGLSRCFCILETELFICFWMPIFPYTYRGILWLRYSSHRYPGAFRSRERVGASMDEFW